MYASPFDNYWVVADQPANVRWSSAGVAYVADTDATYTAWLAAGFEASYIDTEQELADLLNETYPAGSPIPAPPPSTAALGPMSVDIIVATTLLAALGEAIGGIAAIEVIEGRGDLPPPDLGDKLPGLLAAGADTTGSYTVPAGVYKLIVFGQAAGGASGNCTAAASQVGGGGGAGETRVMVLAVQPGQVLDYTIGGRGLANGGTASDLVIGGSAAAFPAIVASKVKVEGPSSNTHVITLPTGIVAGDLLLMFCEVQLGTITTPSGWTIGFNTTFTSAAGASRAEMFYRIADGSEGASLTLTSSGFEQMRSVVHQIRGHDPVTPMQIGFASATSASPNPPSVTLSPAVAKACLWIAACLTEMRVDGAPTGFSNFVSDPNNVRCVATTNKNDNVATLDPSTGFTLSGIDNNAHTVATIAVYPVTPASLMRCKGGTGGATASGGSNGASGTTPTGSGGVRIPPTCDPFGVAAALAFSRGGSSLFGAGAINVRTTTMPGLGGSGPGAGASGAANATGTTAQAGADGAPGMILIFGFGK